jgi:hypothetical protein
VGDNLSGRRPQWKKILVENDHIIFESAKHLELYSSVV